jgi:hypothetical protein
MSPAPNRNRSTNGGGPSPGNLFLETDPEALPTQSRSRRSARTRRPAPTRGRGLVMPIEESVTPAGALPSRPNAAAFTRTSARLGRTQGWARKHGQRADANARRLIAGLAARPYAALLALGVLASMLLALSWMGLALRNATAARHSANRRAAALVTALKRDQGKINTLSVPIDQARAQARPAEQTLHAANAAQPAVHRPAPARAGRHRTHSRSRNGGL